MKVLVIGLALIALAFLVHLIVWKIRIPGRQTKVLLLIFFGSLIVGLLVIGMLSSWIVCWLDYLHISLFVTSITLAYMITYSAIEADSPSLVMIMAINRAGSDGLDKEAFEDLMTDECLIMPRIRDLILDQMVYLKDDRYCLTSKGVLFARIFILYRRLLKAQKGG